MSEHPDLSNETKTLVNQILNSTMSHISLEIAEKMLFKFDGNRSKLFEFIDNCSKAIRLINPQQQEILLAIIETKLIDNARSLVRNRSFNDWETLKNHLLDAYSERRTMGQWQLELNSCRQEINESVIAYSTKIENCYVKLLNSLDENLTREAREACVKLIKEQALSVFISGLNKDLNILVKSQNPRTLETAISIALNEEQEAKARLEISKYQKLNSVTNKYCTLCNRSGHKNYECRSNRNSKSPQSNFRANNSGTSSQTFVKNPYATHNVNHVRNLNHVPENHNVKQKICNYCKKSGHLIQECRKREYNNKKRENENRNNPQNQSLQPNDQTNIRPINLNDQAPQQPALSRNANYFQAEFLQ